MALMALCPAQPAYLARGGAGNDGVRHSRAGSEVHWKSISAVRLSGCRGMRGCLSSGDLTPRCANAWRLGLVGV